MFDLSSRSLLNRTFLADGIFSLIAGAVLIVGAHPLASLVSPAAPAAVMTALGTGLLLWGAFHLASAGKNGPNALAARISIGGDILWQAASLALLAIAHPWLTPIGAGLVIVGMIGVADFLFFKMRGASQARLFRAV
jgi:hypothetical protein